MILCQRAGITIVSVTSESQSDGIATHALPYITLSTNPLIISMTNCSIHLATGDTVRVSLTEDPEFELVPCSTLIRSAQMYWNI